jgi:hypothetical protein
MADESRKRGLPAVEQARELRERGGRMPPPKFWAWAGLIIAVSAIIYWKMAQGRVESDKSALLARQRAVMAELGPRWFPLRDRVERWTVELAKDPGTEVVDKDLLKAWDFRDKPGIYLRLDVDQATSPEAIRKAANDSLRDGFTACLVRADNKNQLSGKECKRTRDCAVGEICNELDRCAPPAQPYNLRVAYRSMRVLSEEWVREAQDASGDLTVRALQAFFEDTVHDDIPVAVDLLSRGQYFMLVLDESVPDLQVPDGGTRSDALRAVPHPSRIGIWRLSDNKLVLRIRRSPEAVLEAAGMPTEERVIAAQRRQAQSCALAMAVRQAMGDPDVGGLITP